MRIAALTALAAALVATPLVGQTPPPPQGPGPGNGAQPPPGPGENQRDRRRMQAPSWYNGDYAANSINAIVMIDDPVTGFGNESLWEYPSQESRNDQSDIAAGGAPD